MKVISSVAGMAWIANKMAAYMLGKSLADTRLLPDRKRPQFPVLDTSQAVFAGSWGC